MGTSNVRVLLRATCIDLEAVTSRLNLFLSKVWIGIDAEDKSETLEACARYDAIRRTLAHIVADVSRKLRPPWIPPRKT